MKRKRTQRTRFAMLIVAIASLVFTRTSDAQQNPNGILPLANSDQPFLFLVRDPMVHEDLELTEEQQAQVNQLNDRIDPLMWTLRNKQPAKMAQIMERATTETKTSLKKFLSREQYRRIQQIELWVLGMKSLLKENIAKYLKLESNQSDQIRPIIQVAQKKMADLQRELNDGGDADELNSQFREVQVNQQQDIVAILTNEQKQKWLKALGKQIDTSKLGRVKFRAPELETSAGWVNSEPLTMEQLKGKVVALHFYAFQ